jgi:uncharacterized protein (DUF2141 family)
MKTPILLSAVLVVLVALFSIEIPVGAQTVSTMGRLVVKVDGLKTIKGELVVKLFRKEDDLFGEPFLQQIKTVTELTAMVEFTGVPYSSYAVFAFHDENNNGTLDHNWMHLPDEPMGWSNQWHFRLFTGMPTFDKTKFVFSQENSWITISLK